MFIAHATQKGEGCDYAISCGETVWILKAETYADAVREIHDLVIGEWLPDEEFEEGHWNESVLEGVILYECKRSEKMPVEHWYQGARQHRAEAVLRGQEQAERAQLERLQKKYAK